MVIVTFRVPGVYNETGYKQSSRWSVVGIDGFTFRPVMQLATDTPTTDIDFGLLGGRYRTTDESTRIFVSEEDYDWTVTCGYYQPGHDPDPETFPPPVKPELLQNAVWPVHMARRLYLWYPKICANLYGWTHDLTLVDVTNNKIVVSW